MRLTRKLLFPILTTISIFLIGIFAYFTTASIQQFDEAEEAQLENTRLGLQSNIQAKQDLAVALALEVANNPEVQAAFAAKDRERLIELTLSSYEALDTQFDIPQFQFHVAPATSFLRLHNLEQFGDDLSSFRQTVVVANQDKKVVSGAEIGRGGLGVRGVVPVFYQGDFIGTVEFGPNIDLAMLEQVKTEHGLDLQILLERNAAEVATFEGAVGQSQGPINELVLQASTLETPFYGPELSYTQALGGNTNVQHFELEGRSYAILSAPLYDFSGQTIGVIDIISDHTQVAQQQVQQTITYIGALLFTLLIIGLGFTYIAGRTLNPVKTLTDVSSAIANGDLSQRTQVQSNDEIGILANTFNTMADQLQNTLQGLEQRVADRTKALATSAEVSRRISTVLNQRDLVKEVVNQVKDAFGYYHTQIYFFDDARENLVMAGGTGEAGETMLAQFHKVAQGRGLVGRAAETNKPVLVSNTKMNSDWLPNKLLPETKSEVAIPISISSEVLGVLDVQHNIVDGLQREDIDALQAIANQVAVALQNIQSTEIVTKRANEFQSVAKISTVAASIGNVDKMLESVVHLTQRGFGLYHAHVFLYDENTNLLTISACGWKEGDEHEGTHGTTTISVAQEQSLVARAARTRQAVIINDVKSDPGWLPNPMLPDTASELAVPMIVGETLLGVLDVQSDRLNAFTEEDASIQTTLAAQVATAIQNARSFSQTQRQAQRETAVNLISQKIQSATTIEKALQIAARELGHALGMKPTIATLDPEQPANEQTPGV